MAKKNLFAAIDQAQYDAIVAVAQLAGTSLRAATEAMIADKMSADHPDAARVRAAWTRYRKGARP